MLLERLLANLGVRFEPFEVVDVPAGATVSIGPQSRTSVAFVLLGDGVIRTPRARQAVSAGYLAVVPVDMPHSLVAAQSALRVVCAQMDVRYGESQDVFGALPDALVIDMSTDEQLRGAMTGLLSEHESPRPGSTVMQRALLDQCLVSIFRAVCDDPACHTPWLEALEDPALGPAIAAVLEDPGGPHTVDSLAETSHLSRAAFARRFRDALGLPPMAYVRELRLRDAARRLTRQQPVGSVARDVGYASRSQFTKAFSARFDVSPTDYRDGVAGDAGAVVLSRRDERRP